MIAWYHDPARHCLGHDPELFYDPARAALAKEICEGCPVAAGCLADELERTEGGGIWAGTTPADRRRMRGGEGGASAGEIEERRARVANLAAAGLTLPEIARTVGVSESTVSVDLRVVRRAETLAKWPTREARIAAALDGLRPTLPATEFAEALDAADDGSRTETEVARILGCAIITVTRHRARRPACAA